MPWYRNNTHRVADGIEIPGVFFLAFIHNGGYHLTTITAYKDNMVDCWGLVSLDEFRQKVHEGWVVTSIPDGAEISIFHLARFTATDISTVSAEDGFIKDVVNAIDELNGRPTTQYRLIDAMKKYRKDDSSELRQAIRQAYSDLPAYCRKYTFGSRMEKHKDIQEIINSTD